MRLRQVKDRPMAWRSVAERKRVKNDNRTIWFERLRLLIWLAAQLRVFTLIGSSGTRIEMSTMFIERPGFDSISKIEDCYIVSVQELEEFFYKVYIERRCTRNKNKMLKKNILKSYVVASIWTAQLQLIWGFLHCIRNKKKS